MGERDISTTVYRLTAEFAHGRQANGAALPTSAFMCQRTARLATGCVITLVSHSIGRQRLAVSSATQSYMWPPIKWPVRIVGEAK